MLDCDCEFALYTVQIMAGHAESIYVQIEIRSSIDRVWQLTQTPELHKKWDLRFTEIDYLPRADDAQPQRFTYETRMGFGLNICGEGETVGSREGPGGERTSALKFWSQDHKSLIREGSGYWKYVPRPNGGGTIQFLTGYDYSVRFGAVGRVVDRWIFRPLIGWATAWSFDRLRIWIEMGIEPVVSMQRSLVYLTARLTLAIIFFYQGVVPKLTFQHPNELKLLQSMGLSDSVARGLCIGIGFVELALGLILVFAWHSRWPLRLILVAMPVAVLAVAFVAPDFLKAPFNPVTLNLSVFALAVIAFLGANDLPSAARCVRRQPREES